MQTWKEFEGNEITHSAAHYLMAIHELTDQWGYARVSDIADKLGIAKGSASQGLKHLKTRDLVIEDTHRMLHLSPEGERLANRIVSRSQVLKCFFQAVLGIDPEQAEIDACKIEHLISPATSERLHTLVHFLTGETAVSKQFRKEFAEFRARGSHSIDDATAEDST